MAPSRHLSVPNHPACRASAQPVPGTWRACGQAALGGGQQPLYRTDGGSGDCVVETRQPEGGGRAVASELGPSTELIAAVVEMKRRNPNWGCPRIAQQMALAFNIQIDKDVVRRILANHYPPGQPSGGPSWLTFLGQMKDSLWSIDLFRCESATLRTHWVLGAPHSQQAAEAGLQ